MNGKSRLIADLIFLLLLSLLCLSCSVGYTMTSTGMTESITIPMEQWQNLKSELNLLNKDLMECQNELTKIKKPSNQLREELAQAQDSLLKLQKELTEQKKDLNLLSVELNESKQSLMTLKEKINKERAVHRRQIWQNRIWCLLIGVGVGCAVK